jgi:hypothetical protein
LKAISRTHAVPIQPSRRFNEGRELTGLFDYNLTAPVQIVRAAFVGLILSAISVAAGLFTYPVLGLNMVTFKGIMDVVFRQPLPSRETIWAALACGVVFGWICFVSWRTGDHQAGQVDAFTKLLAGVTIILGVDIYLFGISPLDITNQTLNLSPYSQVLYAEGVTSSLIVVLTLLYRALAPLSHPYAIRLSLSDSQKNIYGWFRLAAVSFILAGLIAFLVTQSLPLSDNQPVLTRFPLGNKVILITQPMMAALATGLGIVGLCCWSPGFRKVKGRMGIPRLVIVVSSLTAVMLIYRNASETLDLAAAIPCAAVLMILALPLQRSLS